MRFSSYVIFLLRVSETNKWSKHGANQWVWLWSATSSRQFHRKFHFAWKQNCSLRPEIYKSTKPCWLLNWVRIARAVACFHQASLSLPAATFLCLSSPIWPAQAVPERGPKSSANDDGHWFCRQNLQLSSGIAFGSDCQMIGRGSNLDSNLNSAAWPTGCRGFTCSEIPKPTVWNSF